MSGGSSNSNQNANGNVQFTPTTVGGGNIGVGGSVGQGNVVQQGQNSATGAGVDLKLDMQMPGMDGMPGFGGAQLMNLEDLDLQNLVKLGCNGKVVSKAGRANAHKAIDF